MVLTYTAGKLEQSLIEGGVPPLAANSAMNAIGNCSMPLAHRGPFALDYTPRDYRTVTPELRKYRFPNFDFSPSEGARIGPRGSAPREEVIDPEPPREPYQARPVFDPEDGDGGEQLRENLVGGEFIRVDKIARNRVINLRSNFRRIGQFCRFGAFQINGGSIRTAIKPGSEQYITLETKDDGADIVISAGLKAVKTVRVITGAKVENNALEFLCSNVVVLKEDATTSIVIPLKKTTYLTGGALEASGLTFPREATHFLAGTTEAADPVVIGAVDCVV
jgi:hypothetical protein